MEAQDFSERREEMVARQLADRGIHDPDVLSAFQAVPRERFVPPTQRTRAYDDCPLPIGHEQTISQPYMVALMTQALQVRPGQRVLEIGSGSGYQTAVLAAMGARVYTVERIEELSRTAREALQGLGYTEIAYRVGDGTLGWEAEAPFDRIIVTAGSPETPPSLVAQLADGGRMVIPVGAGSHQECLLVTREGDDTHTRSFCPCRFVRLIGREGWSEE